MKKATFLFLFVITGVITTMAQSATIVGTQIRVANKPNGQFNGWTTDWITLDGNDRPVLGITEDKVGDTYYYGISFTFQDETVVGLYEYDGARSAQVRREWNKRVVNCYKDKDGNYMYVEDTSLQELANNQNAWAKYQNSSIQFINADMNIAFK